MDWNTQYHIIGKVALAMLLGGLIGLEREIADKPAGFRTHMLVAGAAALLVGLGDVLLQRFSTYANVNVLRSDPIRIVEAIITGISFLGAGTIFRRSERDGVEGLTTAASILLSSAIGICISLRQFILAGGVTLLALIVLRGLRLIERWIGHKNKKAAGRE
ncbi:MAG: MgtC/SapB family protein [Acidobacteria bacterium]|nr:MgtC/SapB family protein [Acidobacteriota bacterium]